MRTAQRCDHRGCSLSHWPGTLAEWLSFAQARHKSCSQWKGAHFSWCIADKDWASCHQIGMEMRGNHCGLGQNIAGTSVQAWIRLLTNAAHSGIIWFLLELELIMIKSGSQWFSASLGNPAHVKYNIVRYYLNAEFSCPGLEHLYMQKGMFLCLCSLKVSLQLLKALNDLLALSPAALLQQCHSQWGCSKAGWARLFLSSSGQLILSGPPFASLILSSNQ